MTAVRLSALYRPGVIGPALAAAVERRRPAVAGQGRARAGQPRRENVDLALVPRAQLAERGRRPLGTLMGGAATRVEQAADGGPVHAANRKTQSGGCA
jgi:hypothetical protein